MPVVFSHGRPFIIFNDVPHDQRLGSFSHASSASISVVRALTLPEMAALRPGLMPEFPVYASILTDAQEEALAGVLR
jgi:hypothetical protein